MSKFKWVIVERRERRDRRVESLVYLFQILLAEGAAELLV